MWLARSCKDEASRMEKEMLVRHEDELKCWETANAKAQAPGIDAAEAILTHQKVWWAVCTTP